MQSTGLFATVKGLQQGMRDLYSAVEMNLALAKHAEKWEWKEVAAIH